MLANITSERGRNYFDFAFFSGMRPSELIALRWSRIGEGTASIDKALTRGQEGEVKNYRARLVELTSRATDALERQRAITGEGTHVFVGEDGKPYTTTDGPLDAWWKPAIAASGLRYRDARQTRHMFATICLMGGITPGWVARQMGTRRRCSSGSTAGGSRERTRGRRGASWMRSFRDGAPAGPRCPDRIGRGMPVHTYAQDVSFC